jgi:hypothetical protein
MKLLFENWRGYLKEEQGSSVMAHLVGQAGSGKTYFIENTLLKKYPEIVAKDLDDFDDEADAVVASGKGDKSWRQSGKADQIDQKLARKHFDEVQSLVDQFLSSNSDKKVFLAGMSVFPWVEGDNQLDLGNPTHKFYLDIDPKVSAQRRIDRDIGKGLYGDEKISDEDYEENIAADMEHAAQEKAQLLSAGYKSATPEEIVKAVDGVMQGESDETPI